jgi:hypothetical protein
MRARLLRSIFLGKITDAVRSEGNAGGIKASHLATLLFGKMTAKFRKILRKVAVSGTASPAREALQALKG